ncbi:MAG: TonB-dependent receptor [Acidobacteria bacterium]|nr:TonB-dependent receptor [Acidobacteriota bacterium]
MTKPLAVLVMTLALVAAIPAVGHAQDATVNGTVTDATGGVLPGVTVTAVHEATGNTFLGVTDERGSYRIQVRVGRYKVTLELAGFATVAQGFEALVGQTLTVNAQMMPSSVQESVTVTAEAPLIQTTSSTLAGNIDPRQTEDLPTVGGNWLELSLLAPGNRSNGDDPNRPTARNRFDMQLNMDGQQVTNNGRAGAANPRVTQEAIGEFQFVASRWDASQGRSNGVLVNAVTKSGSNLAAGTFSGIFRSDRFNAPDFIQQRVLPYSNRRFNGTYGGPIVHDRAHYFAFYERESEPSTVTYSSLYPSFNVDQARDVHEWNGGARLDFQVGAASHVMVRGTKWRRTDPAYNVASSATVHPSAQGYSVASSDTVYATYSRVLSNRALNEIKGGFTGAVERNRSVVEWSGHPQAGLAGVTNGAPRINLNGYSFGNSNTNWPQTLGQQVLSLRDDFTYSFNRGGRHDVKTGAEYLRTFFYLYNCRPCVGIYDAANARPPASIEQIIPVWNDPNTWNLNALNPFISSYQIGVGEFGGQARRNTVAAWVQDDWQLTQRLTLNLGFRYDLQPNSFANFIEVYPLLKAGRPDDRTDFQPRAGFAYSVDDRTVIRGGIGKYYGQVVNNLTSFSLSAATTFVAQVTNDGRPDFATNPFNGPVPTLDQLRRSGIDQSTGSAIATPHMKMPYSWVSSVGLQRQIGRTMAITADFNFNGARQERLTLNNLNLSYNPATGVNYPFSDRSRRPIPGWGLTGVSVNTGRSNYRGLETAFTKRMSDHYQFSATYTLAGLWDDDPLPYAVDCTREDAESWCVMGPLSFPVAPDLGGEYGLATSDQRHRAVFNGIWELPLGFQASGLYFYGSGARFATTSGGDRRNTGSATLSRLRADGSIVPRNNFVGRPLHRVDVRLSKTFPIGRRVKAEGMLDAFNLFNHRNHNAYTLNEVNAQYGQPADGNLARRLQLGFRLTF